MRTVVRRLATIAVALTLGLLGTTRAAHASTIDFGNPVWNPDGSSLDLCYATVCSNGGYTVTATQPHGAALSWASNSGFGVDSGWLDGLLGSDDEVNGVELLTVSLPTATTLSGFYISNLFREGFGRLSYDEVGYYQINGGIWTLFSANPSSNGSLYVDIAPTIVSTIAFGYPGLAALDIRNDFSVRGLEVATPEPASLVLLGTGLATLAARARKRNRRAA
jgi:hypothetical protein